MPFFAVGVVSLSCSKLNALKGSVFYVALHLEHPTNECGIANYHSYTPTWHIVTFRHRVELYTTVFCTLYLHDAHWVFIQNQRIRIIVYNNNIMTLSKINKFFVGFSSGISTCWHVWIVCPQKLHLAQIHFLQRIKIGLPTVILTQVIIRYLCTKDFVYGCVGWITWIRNKHFVARIAECQSGIHYSFLATYDGLNLAHSVEFYSVCALIESSHGFTQLRKS